MLDPHHREHLRELRRRIAWVRSLTPDSPRYRLWLGDLVEFAHVAYGRPSRQLTALSGILRDFRTSAEGGDEARGRAYFARLDAIERLLAEWEAEAGG